MPAPPFCFGDIRQYSKADLKKQGRGPEPGPCLAMLKLSDVYYDGRPDLLPEAHRAPGELSREARVVPGRSVKLAAGKGQDDFPADLQDLASQLLQERAVQAFEVLPDAGLFALRSLELCAVAHAQDEAASPEADAGSHDGQESHHRTACVEAGADPSRGDDTKQHDRDSGDLARHLL